MKVEIEIEIDTTIAATTTVITNNNNSNSSGNSGNSSNSNNNNSNNNHQHINSNSNSPSSFASSFEFVRFPRAMPTGHSRAAASSASDPPPQSRSGVQRGHVVLPSEEDFARAAAYYRNWLASAPSPSVVAAEEQAVSAGLAPPLVHDPRRHEQAVIGALAELRTGWGHEQAAVAAAASASSGTGAAKEPILFGRLWASDVEEVPLPTNLKRERTEVSEGG